jgi:transcriptional regulator with XRE-family HTH domain
MLRDDSRTRTPEGVFGKELRYYRERAGLSQTDLAALVNVSHDVISKIENGDRAPARDFPERLDAVPELDTGGGLARLWGWLKGSARNRAQGAHEGFRGPFIIADLPDHPPVAYQDAAVQGQVVDSADDVASLMVLWDTIKSVALPVAASVELIEEVAKSWT